MCKRARAFWDSEDGPSKLICRGLHHTFQVDMADDIQGANGCSVTVTWSMRGSTTEIIETEVMIPSRMAFQVIHCCCCDDFIHLI